MTRTIRTLKRAELDTLLRWAAAEGWNPGLGDAEAFWSVDPAGFIGAFVDGAMVAAISAIAYDASFGFIGLYICHPDWRGQGHGKAVWDAGMAHLGTRTIGLDGVPEQQANYASMGFVRAYESIRMSGTLPEIAVRTALESITDPAPILELDRRGFPATRTGFLESWLRPPNRALLAAQGDRAAGYAVSRPCQIDSKIGPIFAQTPDIALDLLAGFSGPVQIDVPLHQSAYIRHLEYLDFTPSFSTARMYRGAAPQIALEQVFAVTSLELG